MLKIKINLSQVIFLISILLSSHAYADFVAVNPLVKHISEPSIGSAGVITIPEGNKLGTEGLFLYYSKSLIPAQGFHPDKLNQKDSESIMLTFDSQSTRKFTQLYTSGGQKFSINGNFKINVGKLRITVHHENQSEPYVTVVFGDNVSSIAFLGLQTVFNSTKPKLISLLEPPSGSAIDTFNLVKGKLYLANSLYTETKLGLGYGGGTNPCASNGVLVESRGTKKNFFAKNIILFSESSRVVVMDGYGQLIVVKVKPERAADGALVCKAEPIKEDL